MPDCSAPAPAAAPARTPAEGGVGGAPLERLPNIPPPPARHRSKRLTVARRRCPTWLLATCTRPHRDPPARQSASRRVALAPFSR
eukprot:56731-Prorocentrum_minimum.AAC.2